MTTQSSTVMETLADGTGSPFHFGYAVYMEGTISKAEMVKFVEKRWSDAVSQAISGWNDAETEIMDATDPSRVNSNAI